MHSRARRPLHQALRPLTCQSPLRDADARHGESRRRHLAFPRPARYAEKGRTGGFRWGKGDAQIPLRPRQLCKTSSIWSGEASWSGTVGSRKVRMPQRTRATRNCAILASLARFTRAPQFRKRDGGSGSLEREMRVPFATIRAPVGTHPAGWRPSTRTPTRESPLRMLIFSQWTGAKESRSGVLHVLWLAHQLVPMM